MDIGTGIAIAGVWIFAGIFGASKVVTSIGVYIGIAIAIAVTVLLAYV